MDGLKAAMDLLGRRTERWSGQQVKRLSISCGSASSREFSPGNIDQLIWIYDERMYAVKAAYYARTGIDRRKMTVQVQINHRGVTFAP